MKKNINNKKGISLIVLAITLAIMIIIASTVLFISSDAVNNSKLAALSSDLTEIEDLIDEYYLNNNKLPVVSGTSYTKSQVVALISKGSDVLSAEITENGDDTATFQIVDLSELDIDSSYRGIKSGGDTTDIYLVSNKTFNLYYLKGEKIAGEYYFSLTEKLTGKKKINNNVALDDSNITISSTTDGIKLVKSTSDWTNELTVNVQTTLESGQVLEYTVADEVAGTSTNGTFTVNLAETLSGNATIKNKFYESNDNKVLTINKYSDASATKTLIATASIDVSNFDMLSGNVVSASNIKHTKYDSFVLVNINGYTDLGGSGVKEARVLYTKKSDTSGNIVAYYQDLPSEITAEYVRNIGKVVDSSLIKLPTDVTEYVLIFIDNAGNLSTPVTYTVTY